MGDKTAQITVRVRPEQRERIYQAAADAGLDVSKFIRAAVAERMAKDGAGVGAGAK
jgi:uncharacterized protein (DUF1778 family)